MLDDKKIKRKNKKNLKNVDKIKQRVYNNKHKMSKGGAKNKFDVVGG